MPRDTDAALTALRAHSVARPTLALVLGSGLGTLAGELADAVSIPTTELPGYPSNSVVGHAGRLVIGSLEGIEVLMIQGRPHLYEGHPKEDVTFPVRLAHAMGARRLLLTNAAGGVNPAFPVGALMLITDHLNLTLSGPSRTPDSPAGSGIRGAFDPEWTAEAERVAAARGIEYRKGVYAWTTGPSYETPAEIRYFRYAGADAVGMSTVPEALQASALGMRVLGISTISNAAAGLSAAPLDHSEVLAVGLAVRARLAAWLRGIVAALPH
jgi:purine-nucleoside phosphorylase